ERREYRRLISDGSAVVAYNLTYGDEYYSHTLQDTYQHYLGQKADHSGVNYWVGQMQAGLSDERLESNSIGSPEYIKDHGGTGQAWVQGMYNDLLGRSPDKAGLSYWV